MLSDLCPLVVLFSGYNDSNIPLVISPPLQKSGENLPYPNLISYVTMNGVVGESIMWCFGSINLIWYDWL